MSCQESPSSCPSRSEAGSPWDEWLHADEAQGRSLKRVRLLSGADADRPQSISVGGARLPISLYGQSCPERSRRTDFGKQPLHPRHPRHHPTRHRGTQRLQREWSACTSVNTDLCTLSAAEQATSTWRLRAHGLAVGNLPLGPDAMWVQMKEPARRRTPVHRLVDCWESCRLGAGEVAPPGITERRAIDGPTDPAPRSH